MEQPKPKKLSTEPYKGVRDFFPDDMAIERKIFDIWHTAARSYGYEEYNASVLEPTELYSAKSGEEIVNEQTYTFIDRGDREVTLRPEMTPSVARMVAARKRELALPLRWYSIANLFRYEQPQRGRVREHWQLNADIFGVDSIQADAEIISLAYQIMKAFGAKDEDFSIRINNRNLLQPTIENMLTSKDLYPQASRLIDKRDKISPEDFEKEWGKLSHQPFKIDSIAIPEKVTELISILSRSGIKNTMFYPIMRGFDYYTGMVFEVFDTNPENRRSLFGGGRYDDLTSLFGGDKIPAVGFGMGDVTIKDFLETHNLLPEFKSSTDIHICTLEERFIPDAETLAAKLRDNSLAVSVNLTAKKIGDQISWADKHHVPRVIIIGDEEIKTGKLKMKVLKTGEEITASEVEITGHIVK